MASRPLNVCSMSFGNAAHKAPLQYVPLYLLALREHLARWPQRARRSRYSSPRVYVHRSRVLRLILIPIPNYLCPPHNTHTRFTPQRLPRALPPSLPPLLVQQQSPQQALLVRLLPAQLDHKCLHHGREQHPIVLPGRDVARQLE
jgi:hypothetical protein